MYIISIEYPIHIVSIWRRNIYVATCSSQESLRSSLGFLKSHSYIEVKCSTSMG